MPECLCSGRHPLHCVVPPHILSSIAANSPFKAVRERALKTLALTQALASARTASSEAGGPSLGERLGFLQGLVAAGQPQRTIYDANNKQRLPGTPVRREGDPPVPGDDAVNEAYDYMGDTYDFYWQVFGRNSVDNRGFPLNGTVHFDQDYDNAFWDGQRMIYGDGDGEQFQRFTIAVDVIGHELTHGVTQYTAGLVYWDQAGAINESISDVFGSLVKQWVNNETAAEADWLIGEGLFTANVQGRAIRDMANPGTAYDDPVLGKDPQPATMADYDYTLQDNKGVHINSGIPNHAFYLAATNLGGYAWEKAGAIWYGALRSPLLRRARWTAQFTTLARITVVVAQQLYGAQSMESEIVGDAWDAVGVNV
jgi:Zn-dependent metalloprotease